LTGLLALLQEASNPVDPRVALYLPDYGSGSSL